PRRGRGRRAARARAGRTLRIYQRRSAADCIGIHERPLPDGERERRTIRDRCPDLLARQSRQPAGVELDGCHSTPACSGVNSWTELQNSQVTTTLPSLTISARSFGAKLLSIADTASREQEHCARSGSGGNTRTPRS